MADDDLIRLSVAAGIRGHLHRYGATPHDQVVVLFEYVRAAATQLYELTLSGSADAAQIPPLAAVLESLAETMRGVLPAGEGWN